MNTASPPAERPTIDLSDLFPLVEEANAWIKDDVAIIRIRYTEKPVWHELTLKIDRMQNCLEKFRKAQQPPTKWVRKDDT